jgi:hypothetical protein
MGAERLLTAFGKTQSLSEWERETGLHRVLSARINAGWSPEEAVSCRGIAETRELWEGANTLPFGADPIAQMVVNEFAPLTLETIGMCFGVSRERVRQIEDRALTKLRQALTDEGADVDIREMLKAWGAERGRSKLGYDERRTSARGSAQDTESAAGEAHAFAAAHGVARAESEGGRQTSYEGRTVEQGGEPSRPVATHCRDRTRTAAQSGWHRR